MRIMINGMKRASYGEEEKAELRRLVVKRKDIIENKKSDMVSLMEKKKTWEELTNEFNSPGNYLKRTTSQLRKLWENIKFRRKVQLSQEKRGRMKNGGGPHTPNIPDDPELDSMGVDIELKDSMDSDTVYAGSGSYVLVGDILMATDVEEANAEDAEPSNDSAGPSEGQMPEDDTTTTPQGPSRKVPRKNCDEMGLRVTRNEDIVEQGRELHELKRDELRKRLTLVDKQLEQDAELYQLRKKELLLKIKKLEREE